MRTARFSILVLGALLALAATAQADTITVGASLSSPELFSGGCLPTTSCGTVMVEATAPATVTSSPVDGVVTAWRVADAVEAPGFGVSVVSRNSDGTYTATASSAAETPHGNQIETFNTDLPIKAGEFIELTLPEGGEIGVLEGQSTEAFFEPALLFGGVAEPEVDAQTFVVGWNADISFSPPVIPAPTPLPAPVESRCVVPKLNGKKLKAAKKKLKAADCTIGKVTKKKGATSKSGKVEKQSPKAGKALAPGSKVKVTLGKG
jgi:hypothetical protein